MNTREEVRGFLTQRVIAIAGLSRDSNAFSVRVFDELTAKGYNLYPVNPKAASIRGRDCYPTLSSLPIKPDGVLLFTPPFETLSVVEEAYELGIGYLWIQQGAESSEAIEFCRAHELSTVSRHCILMFAEPVGVLHALHRFFRRLTRPLLE